MKVILDYDDVLNECNEEAIRKLNKEYGYSYCLEDITGEKVVSFNLELRSPDMNKIDAEIKRLGKILLNN